MTETKTALITGANKGIGFETARQLGSEGITVLVGARDEGRGRAAAEELRTEGVDAHLVQLDVTSEESIAAAAKRVDAEFGRLDILVNNAAIAVRHRIPSEFPVAAMRKLYETNVFGVVAVTNAFLPLLRKAPAGRIVNLSSGLGSLTWLADPESPWYQTDYLAYNSSKTALNAITVSYAKELRETAIKVNVVNPGYCATDLNEHSGYRTAEQGAAVSVRLALVGEDGPTGRFFGEDGPIPW